MMHEMSWESGAFLCSSRWGSEDSLNCVETEVPA